MNNTARIELRPGRERSVRLRHPWLFSGSIAKSPTDLPPGGIVEVMSSNGEWLARAGFNPVSKIPGRIWTWAESETINPEFFRKRIQLAWEQRSSLETYTNAYRILNAESDGLPGIIIDRYGEYAVVQILTAAAELWKDAVVAAIQGIHPWKGIYERSDADVREKEGLSIHTGPLSGAEPDDPVQFREGEWTFWANLKQGHKTGFYLDQRENRRVLERIVREKLRGADLLNVFAYSGAFAVAALGGGAGRVTNVDSSAPALSMAKKNLLENGHPVIDEDFIEGDAFTVLRGFRDAGRTFQAVILDPPKFVFSQQDLMKASRAYKDINWLACRILPPGGYLLTFSCSGLLDEALFQKILFGAAQDAGKNLQILTRLGPAEDHPVRLSFPEGQYLKGFLCRVIHS